jgi:DNA-binding MarR family transcriptional regulator
MKTHSNPAKRLLELMLYTPQIFRHNHCQRGGFFQLTPVQLRTLIFLNRQKQANLKEIAEFLGVTAPTASALIDHLAKQALVKRLTQPAKGDRRLTAIAITAKGKKNATKITALIDRKINRIFSALNHREKETFCRLLEKVALNQTKQ